MTSHDLILPFLLSLPVNGTWVITDQIIYHNPEKLGGFHSFVEAGHISLFCHWLVMYISQLYPDLMSHIQIMRYTSYPYWCCNEYLKRENRSVKKKLALT